MSTAAPAHLDHSWRAPNIFYTPPKDQRCDYCGLAADTPDAGRIPCTPPDASVEDTAWALRDYLTRLQALAGNRPFVQEDMHGEVTDARLRLHQYLDGHNLTGTVYDDRRPL